MMAFIHIVNPALSFALAVAFMAAAILATVVLLLGWWNDPPTRLPRRHSRSLIVLVCVALLATFAFNFYNAAVRLDAHDKAEREIDRIALLLAHPSANSEKLMEAAHSDERDWKLAAARHSRLPDEGIILLAQDNSTDIKLIIAGRIDAPPEALLILVNDTNRDVADAALSNRALPADHVNMELTDHLMQPS